MLKKRLKKIWILNFCRRVYFATRYFNKKYIDILKWGFSSNEDTNFTYNLTDDNILYLALTISQVTQKDYKTILNYINEAVNDIELKNHVAAEITNSPLGKFADKDVKFGRRLGWYAFVRATKPCVVIETGVDKGLGAILLCAALLKNKEEGYNGNYYGTDINPEAGYLLSGKYKAVGKVLYGDSIKSLKEFKKPIDIFINDSDHSSDYEYQEYVTIKPLITEKTIILGDNSHFTNKLALFSVETNRMFLFFKEEPLNHWYMGGGIGISYVQ